MYILPVGGLIGASAITPEGLALLGANNFQALEAFYSNFATVAFQGALDHAMIWVSNSAKTELRMLRTLTFLKLTYKLRRKLASVRRFAEPGSESGTKISFACCNLYEGCQKLRCLYSRGYKTGTPFGKYRYGGLSKLHRPYLRYS